MKFLTKLWVISFAIIGGIFFIFAFINLGSTSAKGNGDCSEPYFINITLPTKAKWTMCWEERASEGIVLYDITYTPPDGPERLVLAQASLAQLHVPYDDNSRRLHDLSDFGLGSFHLRNLTAEECPDGTLLESNAKNILCTSVKQRGYAYKNYSKNLEGYLFSLFSVSAVGAYNYIVQWNFYDNGTIEPVIGAAGELQFEDDDPNYGWPLDSGNTRYGLAHIHNYYWRLDFDLVTEADDVVEELASIASADRSRFTVSRTQIVTEAARQVSSVDFRTWRIMDKTVTNSDGHSISYELEPDPTYIFRGPAFEPWTQAEFYVTRYNACEKWATHNPTTGGCADNLNGFVNGENVDGNDLVVWYGHSFHHLPRDEDDVHMHTHWNSFTINPRDWTSDNPLYGVTPTAPTPTPYPTGAVSALSQFSADWNEGGEVQVQWQTRTEINTAAYSLMRSTNGLTWTQVYTTPNQFPCGAYSGTEPLTYAFTDTNVISPTYYLYQLEFNGDDCNAVSVASTWIARARPAGWIDTFLPVIVKDAG